MQRTRNTYRTSDDPDVTILSIARGDGTVYEFLIDTADVPMVSQHDWRLLPSKDRYVYAGFIKRIAGKPQNIRLHRYLLSVTDPKTFVDHTNRDTLDTRRSNLRLSSHGQNRRNSNNSRNNTSGYRGVTHYRRYNKWQAEASVNGKKYHLGYFKDPVEAAIVYDRFVIANHGGFHHLNFPDLKKEAA